MVEPGGIEYLGSWMDYNFFFFVFSFKVVSTREKTGECRSSRVIAKAENKYFNTTNNA